MTFNDNCVSSPTIRLQMQYTCSAEDNGKVEPVHFFFTKHFKFHTFHILDIPKCAEKIRLVVCIFLLHKKYLKSFFGQMMNMIQYHGQRTQMPSESRKCLPGIGQQFIYTCIKEILSRNNASLNL